jgi:ribosomal protein S18 acetylase RimI-like enzyme
MTTRGRTAQLRELDRAAFAALQDEVLDVYAEAMDVGADVARARRSILATHLQRAGLLAVGAFEPADGADPGSRLVGIAYGYLGAPGQWWHDQVRAALDERTAARWLDGSFEVCEFHVRPASQGTGLGRELMSRLLSLTDAPTAVLTTPDRDTRARRFYRTAGWLDLVGGLRFPGDPREFAVLALDLRPGRS